MKRISKRISILSLIAILCPFIQSILSGTTAIATTITDQVSTPLFQNEHGQAALSYQVDADNQTINWYYRYQKNSELASRFGIELTAAGQSVLAEAVTTTSAVPLEQMDGQLRESQAVADLGAQTLVTFQTPLLTALSVTPVILVDQENGDTTDLLAGTLPVTIAVDLPQASSETSDSQAVVDIQTGTTETEPPSLDLLPADSDQTSKQAAPLSQNTQIQNLATGRDITKLPEATALKDSPAGKTIFDSALLWKNGQPITDGTQIKLNDALLLQYTWSIPETLRRALQADDYFDFRLPDKFVINAEELSGPLADSAGTVFGHFVIKQDGSVRITFTAAVTTNSGIKGTLNVAGKVDAKVIQEPGEIEIEVPFVNEEVHVVPDIIVPNAKALSKAVAKQTADKDISDNKGTVTWQVIANQTGSTMTNGVITENLPAGVTYAGNLKVLQQAVDLTNGKLTGAATDVTAQITAPTVGAATFNLPLPTSNHAYVITFDTAVDFDKLITNSATGDQAPTAAKLSAKVINQVSLSSKETGDVAAKATASFGSASTIAKTGTYDAANEVVAWTVTFTKAGLTIPAGTTFVDVMNNGQTFTNATGKELTLTEVAAILNTSFHAGNKNSNKSLSVAKDQDGQYTLSFPQGIADSFALTYYTSAQGNATSFKNTVTWNGKDGSKTVDVPKKESGLTKVSDKSSNSGGEIASAENTGVVNWTLTLNQENQALDSWYLIDTLTNTTWDQKLASIVVKEVKKGTSDANASVLKEGTDYTITNLGSNKFTITYKRNTKTDSKFIIAYTSTYDATKYSATIQNSAVYHYTVEGRSWSSKGDSSFKTPSDKRATIAGNKSGAYNSVTNQVAWTINLNTGKIPYGGKAVLTDPIPAGLNYDASVAPTLLRADGNPATELQARFVAAGKAETINGTTVSGGVNGVFVVSGFPKDGTETYQIAFTTTVAEAEKLPTGSVTNTASYQDDTNKALTLTAKVAYTQVADYVNKRHQYNRALDGNTIHYTIEVNPGKLDLRNVVLVDGTRTNIAVKNETITILADGVDVTDQFAIQKAEQEFKIDFGNIKTHYTVSYDAAILYNGDPGAQIPVQNKATVTGDNIKTDIVEGKDDWQVTVPDAGGTAQGEVRQLTVQKNDTDTGQPVAGAKLALYRGAVADGKLVIEKETDEHGQVTFDKLTFDTYTVIETAAAPGYYISEQLKTGIQYVIDQDVAIDVGKTVTVTNQQLGAIELTKVDSAAPQQTLDGAIFKLYQQDGTTQVTADGLGNPLDIFTTTNGKVTIANLIPGTYVLKELAAPTGYHLTTENTTVKVEPSKTTEQTIANELNKGTIEFRKTDGARKLTGAEFTLSYDADPSHDVVKTVDDNGVVQFDLEANKVYTVKETKNPYGYAGTYELTQIKVAADSKVVYGADATEYHASQPLTVTNELITLDINGLKTWELLGNDEEFVLPQQILVQLYQTDHTGNSQVMRTAVVTAANGWQYSFADLPKYDLASAQPFAYEYTVKEVVTGFAAERDGYDLKNTVETTKLAGTKTWDTLAEQYGLIPTSITVNLEYSLDGGQTWQAYTRGGTAVTANVTAADNWSYEFADLPQTYQGAKSVSYRVVETPLAGFTPTVTDHNIKNALDTTKITVEKNWSDYDNHYQTRPTSLNFTLLVKVADEWQPFAAVYGVKKELTLSGLTNRWIGTYQDLPKYDRDGQLIQYAVKEDLSAVQDRYVASAAQVAAEHGGTAVFNNTLATTAITVTKTWQDYDNQYQTRPEAVRFQILTWAEGTLEALATVVRTPANEQGLYTVNGPDYPTLTIDQLPAYNQLGQKLNYKVQEVDIAGNYRQTPTYTQKGNAYFIDNQLATTSVTVHKYWEDQNDQDRLRPDRVTVALLQNGAKIGELQLTADQDWTASFAQLPKYDKTGAAYDYQIREEQVPDGYVATVNGHDITNTHTPAGRLPRTNSPTSQQRSLPRTGDSGELVLMLIGAGLIVGGLVLKRRKTAR